MPICSMSQTSKDFNPNIKAYGYVVMKQTSGYVSLFKYLCASWSIVYKMAVIPKLCFFLSNQTVPE